MRVLSVLLLCIMLLGCATTRNVVILPTLEECPEPVVPEFSMMPEGHIGGINPLDVLMGNFNLLENYTIKLRNTTQCYKANVDRIKQFQKQQGEVK